MLAANAMKIGCIRSHRINCSKNLLDIDLNAALIMQSIETIIETKKCVCVWVFMRPSRSSRIKITHHNDRRNEKQLNHKSLSLSHLTWLKIPMSCINFRARSWDAHSGELNLMFNNKCFYKQAVRDSVKHDVVD